MLLHLHIQNFTLIDDLDLDLSAGMTALTGETGAGKSILLDALGLALGDRADATMIKPGNDRAEISASFTIEDQPQARKWLLEHDLSMDNECLIRRVVTSEGRSKGYINGQPMPMQALKELGELLVDIHGQHEHQSLMRKDIQRELLDDYAGHHELLDKVKLTYQNHKSIETKYFDLLQAQSDRTAQLDLVKFQVKELSDLALQAGEFAQLEEEHKRLANAGQLLQTCQLISNLLFENEENSIHEMLSRCQDELTTLEGFDRDLDSVGEMLNSASIQIDEASSELRRYLNRLDMDPERLQYLEQRIADILQICRKHHCQAEELPGLLDSLQARLFELEHADIQLDKLKLQRQQSLKEYQDVATALSTSRSAAATKLNELVSQSMHHLGMQSGKFYIQLLPIEDGKISATGLERVEFLVCTNAGQTLQPLTKIASGGELSRISLAIQVILASTTHIPTLIFDEVDVGIGGGTAEVVGKQLALIGKYRQVLCVTHLAQVAAQAKNHLKVSKKHLQNNTILQVQLLKDQDRVMEIARMVGGLEITDNTLSHAREILNKSNHAESVMV